MCFFMVGCKGGTISLVIDGSTMVGPLRPIMDMCPPLPLAIVGTQYPLHRNEVGFGWVLRFHQEEVIVLSTSLGKYHVIYHIIHKVSKLSL